MPKSLTLAELQARQRRTVQGLNNLGNSELADEFAAMTPQEFAQDRGIEIQNPRYRIARKKTESEVIEDLKDRLSDLEDQVEELQEENESLQGRLDAAAEAIAGEEGEEEEDDEEDENDED